MSIPKKIHARGAERRRKRAITPIIYLIVEVIFLWLVLVLIQIKFSMFEWSFFAISIFSVGTMYSIAKTVHIYQRQGDYSTEEEHENKK